MKQLKWRKEIKKLRSSYIKFLCNAFVQLDGMGVSIHNFDQNGTCTQTPIAAEAPTRKTIAGSGKTVHKMIVTSIKFSA